MKEPDHLGVNFAFMRKILMKLGREEKFFFPRSPFQPRFRVLLQRRPVKCAVNLDAIDKPAYVLELVDFRISINNPLPVRIRPARYAYVNLSHHTLYFPITARQSQVQQLKIIIKLD